jgi:hypothetical protein
MEGATPCWITKAPQQFGPAAKGVQSPQEICQIVDRVMARTTQVPESPRSLSNLMDLNLLQGMVRPPGCLKL